MDKFDRFQQLHRVFKSHRNPLSLIKLAEQLECSPKTVSRLIEKMRDFLNAPISYNKSLHGYHYNQIEGDFELPGLWMTGPELQSLVVIIKIISSLDQGLLSKEFELLEKQIKNLLKARGIHYSDLTERISWLPLESHFADSRIFSLVSESVLAEQQMTILYEDFKGKKTSRDISPLRLIYYRENWYLLAWCHLRSDLRSFMLYRICDAFKLDAKAKQVDKTLIDEYYPASYGIFSGKAKNTAHLKFVGDIAREVSTQQWHPNQNAYWIDQAYHLKLPYNEDKELIRDILKFGKHVEVIEPEALRKKITDTISELAKLYKD